MPVRTERKQIKSTKTNNALNAAMLTLLDQENFGKITVNKLCNEALVSRATFYAHYADKYDMLKYWLVEFQPHVLNEEKTFEQIEEVAGPFVKENERIIKNLLYGADTETLDIVGGYVLSMLDAAEEEGLSGDSLIKYAVLSNFYSGGIIYYLNWQIKNQFPSGVPTVNVYLYRAIGKLREMETA